MHAEARLQRSLAIQSRVIYALLMREIITRYGRNGIGALWLVFEPMLFTLGVTALWYVAGFHVLSDIPIIAFAITGYSTVLLWRNAANRCANAIEPNLTLLYHRNVKVIDIFLARIILEVTGASGSFLVMTTICIYSGLIAPPDDLAVVLIGWLLMIWLSISMGLFIGALSERSETFERTWHVATYLLFPLSGAAFLVDWLPTSAQDTLLWFPMVHGTELIRHGYFGETIRTYESETYLIISNSVLMLISLVMVRDTARKVQPQ